MKEVTWLITDGDVLLLFTCDLQTEEGLVAKFVVLSLITHS